VKQQKEKALKNSDARRSLRSSSSTLRNNVFWRSSSNGGLRNSNFWRSSSRNGRSRFVSTKS
jgi:hypothetical protein